ncbi:MAG: hypothetical protein MN733_00985 [Nitrososphaera sp.]|nr:hypothetical protein [Nitrososphaera sp.]
MDIIVEASSPTLPNVDTRKNPKDEQLAHVLEMTLIDEPEKSDARLNFSLEFLNT